MAGAYRRSGACRQSRTGVKSSRLLSHCVNGVNGLAGGGRWPSLPNCRDGARAERGGRGPTHPAASHALLCVPQLQPQGQGARRLAPSRARALSGAARARRQADRERRSPPAADPDIPRPARPVRGGRSRRARSRPRWRRRNSSSCCARRRRPSRAGRTPRSNRSSAPGRKAACSPRSPPANRSRARLPGREEEECFRPRSATNTTAAAIRPAKRAEPLAADFRDERRGQADGLPEARRGNARCRARRAGAARDHPPAAPARLACRGVARRNGGDQHARRRRDPGARCGAGAAPRSRRS